MLKDLLVSLLNINPDELGVYLIHLERATERLPQIKELKQQLGLTFIDFPSADGKKLIEEGHLDWSVEYEGMHCGAGNLGCTISHVNICKDALQKKFKYVMIFEDDSILKKSYEELEMYLSISLNLLKENSIKFDLFLLGNTSHLKYNPITHFLAQIFEFYGTNALLMNEVFVNSILIEHEKTFKDGKVRSADDLYSKTIQSNNFLAFGCLVSEYFFEQKKNSYSYIVEGIRK
jgi:GR25 family glycosyltransferase involved in LPS biosynthesis